MSPDVARTLTLLQEGENTLRLLPQQVQPVLDMATRAYTVSMDAERLGEQFPCLTSGAVRI